MQARLHRWLGSEQPIDNEFSPISALDNAHSIRWAVTVERLEWRSLFWLADGGVQRRISQVDAPPNE
jgi:hypothetical protein